MRRRALMALSFDLFGPVTAWSGGTRLLLGPPKQRAVLALLLLDVGRIVPVARFVQELWGEHPPDSALVTLRAYLSRLRSALEPGRRGTDSQSGPILRRRSPGYLLDASEDDVDIHRFARLVAAARSQLTDAPAEALHTVTAALDIAAGPALVDVWKSSAPRRQQRHAGWTNCGWLPANCDFKCCSGSAKPGWWPQRPRRSRAAIPCTRVWSVPRCWPCTGSAAVRGTEQLQPDSVAAGRRAGRRPRNGFAPAARPDTPAGPRLGLGARSRHAAAVGRHCPRRDAGTRRRRRCCCGRARCARRR